MAKSKQVQTKPPAPRDANSEQLRREKALMEFFREAAAKVFEISERDAQTRAMVLQSLQGDDDIVMTFEVTMVHKGAILANVKGVTSIPDGAASYARGDAVRKVENFVDTNLAAALVGKLHAHFAMDDVKPAALPQAADRREEDPEYNS